VLCDRRSFAVPSAPSGTLGHASSRQTAETPRTSRLIVALLTVDAENDYAMIDSTIMRIAGRAGVAAKNVAIGARRRPRTGEPASRATK